MVVEVACDGAHAGRVEDGTAAAPTEGDISQEGDDEEGLFGGVEIVDEKIAVDVPAL